VVLNDPYHYGEENPPAIADLGDGILVAAGASSPASVAEDPRPSAE
jgi:hypothetical protein